VGSESAQQPGALALLLSVARREGARRLGWDGDWRGGLKVLGLLVGLVLVGAALLPAQAPLVGGDDPGGDALEVAFWLTCVAAAVSSFRVMESFFRTGDARILAPLPLSLDALFAYRLLRGLGEVGLWTVGGAVLMTPLLWRGDWQVYVACAGVWSGGALTTLAVGFGVQMYAANARLAGESGFNAHGPTAGIMAPGLALAVSVFVVLLEKLVAEEFLKGGFNGGARFGLLVSSVIIAGSLLASWRWFRASFYQMYGRFFEADLFVLDSGYAYFQEGAEQKTHWALRGLSGATLAWAQKDWAQLERRDILPRLLGWLAAGGMGVFLASAGGAQSMGEGGGLLVLFPLLVIGVLINPWARLWSADLEPGIGLGLPVDPLHVEAARQRVALAKAAGAALILGAAILLGGYFGHVRGSLGASLLGALLVLCAHPLLSWAAPRGALLLTASLAAVAAAAGALAALSVWMVAPLCLLILATGKLLQTNKDKIKSQ
jgi:hypothetical protein